MENKITTITEEWLMNHNLSYSKLKHFRVSPKHFIHNLNNPEGDKEAYVLGRAVERLVSDKIFGVNGFEKSFRPYEKPSLRSNDGKQSHQIALDLAKKDEVTLITPEDVQLAKFCVESLFSHNVSRILLEAVTKEQIELKWKDKENNLNMKGVADYETTFLDEDFVLDLKTTRNAEPDAFSRDVFKMDYILQTGTYREGYKRTKFRFPYFIFLAVETVEPFAVSVNFCDNKFLNKAQEEYKATTKAFRYCVDKNLWHEGYEFWLFGTKDYHSIHIPAYYKGKSKDQ